MAQSTAASPLEAALALPTPAARLIALDTACQRALRTEEVGQDTLFIVGLSLGEELYGIPANAERAVRAARYLGPQGEEEKGVRLLRPYYEQRAEIVDTETRAAVMAAYGNLLTNSFAYQPAIDVWEEVLELYRAGSTAGPVAYGRAHIDLGKNLFSIGRYGEAGVSLNRAKEFYQEANDSLGLKFSHNELGNLYGRIGLYDEAVRQFREMERYDTHPSRLTVGFQAANIGRAFLEEDRYEEALAEYRKGMAVRPFEPADAYVELYLINGIIECHYYLGQPDSVGHNLAVLEAAYAAQGSDAFYDFLLLQSRFFDATLKGGYPRAETILTTLYEASAAYSNDAELVAYAGYFADLYRRWGKYDKALAFQDRYVRITDSVRAANKTHALVLYQTQYETKEKEQQIEVLETERELQLLRARTNRNRFVYGGVALLLLFGGLLMWQYLRNKVKRAQRVAELRDKISRDLHDDVGSILTGLAMKTELLTETLPPEHRPGFGEVATLSRSAMHRMRDAVWIMDASRDNWRSLRERIEEFAYEILAPQDIAFSLESPDINDGRQLDGEVRQHLYLIVKEAITNVVKHAPSATRVRVSFQQSGAGWQLAVENDGLMESSPKGSAGSGLRNIRGRAEALGGSLTVEQANGVFRLVVLP